MDISLTLFIYIYVYKCYHSYQGHSLSVRTLCFTPDSAMLVSGSDDKKINLYDVYIPFNFGVIEPIHFI